MHQPALPTAHVEVPAGEHGPMLLGLNAEAWVYVSLTIFLILAIFVAKAPKRVTDILDQRIAETKRSLDEARSLKAEAEALLSGAQATQAAQHRDAEAILAHAGVEADQLLAKARDDADALVVRRGRMAEDKIAAAERQALADVRTHAARAAAAAAASLIAASHDAAADKPLVDKAIARLN